jgi:hypothetical protein
MVIAPQGEFAFGATDAAALLPPSRACGESVFCALGRSRPPTSVTEIPKKDGHGAGHVGHTAVVGAVFVHLGARKTLLNVVQGDMSMIDDGVRYCDQVPEYFLARPSLTGIWRHLSGRSFRTPPHPSTATMSVMGRYGS